MAKTAVVNKKKKKKGATKRKRNYGAAAKAAPRKRRRSSTATPARRRSNNSPRRRNPGMFDFDSIMDVVPSATGGVWLGRWGVKLAGKFEDNADGIPEPGLKHAIAILIAANMGGDMLGNMMGSSAKGDYARIACLGFGGDLFMRKRFMRDSDFVRENLSLEGVGYSDGDGAYNQQPTQMAGFQQTSQLGANGEHLMIGPDGQLYHMPNADMQAPPNYDTIRQQVSGFSRTSSLGMAPASSNQNSSFGY